MILKTKIFFTLTLLILFSACSVTKRDGEYKHIKQWPPTSNLINKPTLRLKLNVEKLSVVFGGIHHITEDGEEKKSENKIISSIRGKKPAQQKYQNYGDLQFSKKIIKAYKESDLFSKIIFDEEEKTDLIAEVRLNVDFNELSSLCFSCCLLDILPSTLDCNTRLITTLKKNNGDIVGSYSLDENISQFRHMPLILVAPFTDSTEEIFYDVVYDLSCHSLLKASSDINKIFTKNK